MGFELMSDRYPSITTVPHFLRHTSNIGVGVVKVILPSHGQMRGTLWLVHPLTDVRLDPWVALDSRQSLKYSCSNVDGGQELILKSFHLSLDFYLNSRTAYPSDHTKSILGRFIGHGQDINQVLVDV